MEQYLIDEYNVIEDEDYLQDEDDIKPYFRDSDTNDLFPCGQGYYTDKASVICKVGDKFYRVYIEASTCSSKQDYGDRLYWIESIDSVDYCEIEKPLPKEKNSVQYDLYVTYDQHVALEKFIKKQKIHTLYKGE